MAARADDLARLAGARLDRPYRPGTPPVRAITAAAKRIDLTARNGTKILRKPDGWQDAIWQMYDEVPEVKYIGRFYGNALSRIRLVPSVIVDADEAPVNVDDATRPVSEDGIGLPESVARLAREATERLSSGSDGMAGLMRGFGENLGLVGDSYLVGRDAQDDDDVIGDEVWQVYSVSAVTEDPLSGQISVKETPNGDGQPLGGDPTLFRIWRRHARWPGLADSNLQACLAETEELLVWSRMMRAIARSGTNAGVLLVPTELELDRQPRATVDGDGIPIPDPDDPITPGEWSKLESALMAQFLTPADDDSTGAAVAPAIVRGKAEFLKEMRHLLITRTVDDKVLERIEFLIRRLAHGADLPVEVLTGVADANHWCHDDATEVLTERGWLGFDDIAPGDLALSLNHETGASEWHPVSEVQSWQVESLPMLSIEGRYHSSLTTLNHRWPLLRKRGREHRWDREWAQSKDIMKAPTAHRILRSAPCADLPTEPKWSDAFVELVGWFFTEGSCRYRDGRGAPQVAIYQSQTANPGHCARIRAALTALFGPPKDDALGAGGRFGSGRPRAGEDAPAWREVPREAKATEFRLNAAAAADLVLVADRRMVSPWFIRQLTASQLELFLATAVRADGSTMTSGARLVGQKDPAMLDAVELAAILAGYAVTRGETEHDGFTRHTQHWVTFTSNPLRQTFTPKRANVQAVGYTGRIWCPVVAPHHSVLARRNGRPFWTGQTGWQIEDSTYKAHVEPTAQIPAAGLTAVYLRPVLRAQGVADGWLKRLVFALDPSALVVRPNRGADARELHAVGALSDAALLDAVGFPDTALPTDEERIRRYVTDRAIGGVGLTAELMNRTLTKGDPVPAEAVHLGDDGSAVVPVGGGDPVPPEDGGEPAPPTAEARPLAIVAAAQPLPDLGQTLADIERRLRERLQTAASADMDAALRRAGNRLRGAVQGQEDAGQVNGQAAELVGLILGAERVAQLVDVDQLLAGSFDGMQARWDAWLSAAEDEAAAAVLAATSGGDAVDLTAAEGDRSRGWAVLLAGLLALAGQRFLVPSEGPGDGEFDVHSAVPAGIIRDALAVAGGGSPAVAPYGTAGQTGPGGLLTGQRWSSILQSLGIQRDAWTWRTGAPSQPFEPHQRLSGTVFETWDDPVLSNPGTFPRTSHLYPGDHRGCACDVQATLVLRT